MYAIDEETARTETVTLYVTDPARSQEFYQDLFGLIMRERPGSGSRRMLEVPGSQASVSIILRHRQDAADGPMWLSVEVGSVSEVLDLYLLAIMMGAKAMLPRKRGERWSTVVTDPDGNRISVWTHVDDEGEDGDEASLAALRPQRWDWRMAPPRTDLIDDEVDRMMRDSASATLDGALGMPGRAAAGADRLDRCFVRANGTGRTRGGTPSPGRDRDKTLEGKE